MLTIRTPNWYAKKQGGTEMSVKTRIALAACFLSACAGSPGEPGIVPPAPSPVPPPAPLPVDGGEWGVRAGLIEPNSELPVAELNG